jgi:hypothetical protein
VGGSCTYDVLNSDLSKFSLGASISQGNIFAAVTTAKFDEASLGLLYTVNSDLKIASKSSHSAKEPLKNLTVGCVFNAQNFGVVKGKFTSDGSIQAALVKDIAKGVTANPSFKISAKNPADSFSYGLGVTIG